MEGLDVPALYVKAIRGNKEALSAIKKHCRDDLEVTRKVLKKLLPLIKVKYQELF